MNTILGRELASIVDDIDGTVSDPVAADLWRAGARRRRWAVARTTAVVVAALALVGLVVLWPGPGAGSSAPPPVVPVSPSTPRSYPSVIADPHVPSPALSARRPMSAAYVDGQSLYAVDDHGQVWKAPAAAGQRVVVALSPDGRYATDGLALFDFVDGTSSPVKAFAGLGEDYARTGAAWSPDSRHFAVVATGPAEASVVVGTPAGGIDSTPSLADLSGVAMVAVVSWLDDHTVLSVVSAPPSPEDQTRGPQLKAFTWALGSGAWTPRGILQLPPHTSLLSVGPNLIGTSPDGTAVAMPVENANARGAVSVLTWPLPSDQGSPEQPVLAVPGTRFAVDGLSWRGSDLVAVRAGSTFVARTGQVLSESTDSGSRPFSWRAGAFEGPPYYNTWAVWRDRLFVWAVLLGGLVLIVLVIRLGRPLARRAGMIDRYASPFPIEARWIFSR